MHKELFWEHEGNRAVIKGQWKIVSEYDYQNNTFKEWELYNIKKDRAELENLRSQYPDKVLELIEEYNEWADRAGVIGKTELDSLRNVYR